MCLTHRKFRRSGCRCAVCVGSLEGPQNGPTRTSCASRPQKWLCPLPEYSGQRQRRWWRTRGSTIPLDPSDTHTHTAFLAGFMALICARSTLMLDGTHRYPPGWKFTDLQCYSKCTGLQYYNKFTDLQYCNKFLMLDITHHYPLE